jgi:arsenate reductase (glutaredoxin)
MYKIYHNPRCRKSREGLEYLQKSGYPFEIIRYMDEPLSEQALKTLFMKLNLDPPQALRTQEDIFKKELKGRIFTSEEWISIICQNPCLLQRPIVEGRYRAVIAVPPERAEEVFTRN